MNVEKATEMDPQWAQILEKQQLRRTILDSGATSGAAGVEDEYGLSDME